MQIKVLENNKQAKNNKVLCTFGDWTLKHWGKCTNACGACGEHNKLYVCIFEENCLERGISSPDIVKKSMTRCPQIMCVFFYICYEFS